MLDTLTPFWFQTEVVVSEIREWFAVPDEAAIAEAALTPEQVADLREAVEFVHGLVDRLVRCSIRVNHPG